MSKYEEIPRRFGMSKRGIIYSWLYAANLLIWLSLVLKIRERVDSPNILFLLGFMPNFFAAIAIYFKILEIHEKDSRLSRLLPEKAFSISLLVFVILLVGELLQEYLLNGVFDRLDLMASFIGLGFSIFVHQFIQSRVNL